MKGFSVQLKITDFWRRISPQVIDLGGGAVKFLNIYFCIFLIFFSNECIISQEYCVKISCRSEQN